jgi:tRNA-specific 2-thiouridylase
VAMSGGVDSSVAAALMVRRGFEVVGLTMQIWQENQTDSRHSGCCSLGAVEDARRVGRALGIPHYVVNYRDEFRDKVISDFVSEYAAGRTPNPCIQCNRHLKFAHLIEKMRELGCRTLVTGHYARVRRLADGSHRLLTARARDKDQSYVLYMLDQDSLAVSYFPLGELDGKETTRRIASELGLHVADKPDSQEICFVSEEGGYREFLGKVRPEMFVPGEIVDDQGRVLARHEGIAGFTVGQRRGIRVAAPGGRPLYVLRLEPSLNRVVVGENDALLTRTVFLRDLSWSSGVPTAGPVRVTAKIRYNMDPQPAVLWGGDDMRMVFDSAVRAVTPGQTAVAYRGCTVIAGGTIRRGQKNLRQEAPLAHNRD